MTVSPRVDLAFKKIFGVDENKDLLMSLINSIVSEEDKVTYIDILNPYNAKNFKKDKLSILDIKAKDTRDQLYNIEIQISDEGDYDKRALYYWTKLYGNQLVESVDYGVLKKSIGIHILNFLSIPESPKYHNTFVLKEKEINLHRFKDIELHTIELHKFEKDPKLNHAPELSDYLAKVKTSLDRWMLFLTKHALLDENALPQPVNEPIIKKALHTLNVMNFSKAEREEYEEHLKWLRFEASAFKKQYQDGKAEGKAEEKIEMVKSMLAENADIKFISKVSGLSEDEIRKLQS